jgi:hypothetical protein
LGEKPGVVDLGYTLKEKAYQVVRQNILATP